MKQTDFRDVPDELWERIETLLAPFKRKRSGGGSRPLSRLTVLAGILYKCRSGCQWAMFPACYGSKSTVYEHLQRWNGVDARWQAMDGFLLQAPARSQKISV